MIGDDSTEKWKIEDFLSTNYLILGSSKMTVFMLGSKNGVDELTKGASINYVMRFSTVSNTPTVL